MCRDLIMGKQLSLISISKLFTKFNSVYKQASIERSTVRKKLTEGMEVSIDKIALFDPHGMTKPEYEATE